MLGAVSDAEDVLDFWFGDLSDGIAGTEQRKLWFTASEEFDAQCRSRFSALLGSAPTIDWSATAHDRLAYVILCDQLPRNIHRGTAEAFAFDALALKFARRAVEQRCDLELGLDERSFLYMPFEHSESIIDQHTAVGLFASLRDEAPTSQRSYAGNNLRFARKHRDIIVRFGRFPHRNQVLGRSSTEEELEFIAASVGFGQN